MMANRKSTDRQVNIAVSRPEDVRLFEFMSRRAYDMRYPLGTFILVSLHEAFKGQIEEDEVNALAEEAAAKVRYRTSTSTETPSIPVEPPPAKPQPVSMERAMKDAEAQIAALDAIASTVMKKKVGARKGVPTPPPMPQ
jgi:hypothetical protein